MTREIKLALGAGAVVATAVVVFLMTSGDSSNPAPPAKPPRTNAPVVAAPQVGEEGASANVPLVKREVKRVEIDARAEALGWQFEFPWPPVEATEAAGGGGVRVLSPSGNGIQARYLLKAVAWEQQFLEFDQDARAWLKGIEEQSERAFYATVFAATADQAPTYEARGEAGRLKLALAAKEALSPRGVSAFFAFTLPGARVYQVGDPSTRRVTLYLLPDYGRGIELDFFSKAGAAITQAEVDSVVGSLRPALVTRDAGAK